MKFLIMNVIIIKKVYMYNIYKAYIHICKYVYNNTLNKLIYNLSLFYIY